MTTHLEGQMPHNLVADILHQASRIKSKEDLDALGPKIVHASRVFSSVLHEFRAAVPAQERNAGMSAIAAVAPAVTHPDEYCPFANAFHGLEDAVPRDVLERPIAYFIAVPPVRGCYDYEYSAMNTLLIHGRLQHLRDLVDLGADLSTWYRQGSSVGGGIADLVRDNVVTYLWLNQLLLHNWLPEFDVFTQRHNIPSLLRPASLAEVVPRYAAKSLLEMLSGYDNHAYRRSPHAGALSHALTTTHEVTMESMRTYLKDHIFPELYRAAHLLLYSAMRREGLPFSVIENKEAKLKYLDLDIEREFRNTLADAIVELMPPVHGVKTSELRDNIKFDMESDSC